MNRLDPNTLDLKAHQLTNWQLSAERGGQIGRTFVFADFAQAFAFMTQVALWAERHDHHPDWRNVFNRVEVKLTTHDAQGLTMRDIALATHMETLAGHWAGQGVSTLV